MFVSSLFFYRLHNCFAFRDVSGFNPSGPNAALYTAPMAVNFLFVSLYFMSDTNIMDSNRSIFSRRKKTHINRFFIISSPRFSLLKNLLTARHIDYFKSFSCLSVFTPFWSYRNLNNINILLLQEPAQSDQITHAHLGSSEF